MLTTMQRSLIGPNPITHRLRMALLMAAIALLSACKTPNPTVENAPNFGLLWIAPVNIPLDDYGYQREEFFFSGTANSYVNSAPLDEQGYWQVEESGVTADYKSRMVVYRPQDPADFNGTVIIEWMNVSAGIDTPTEWVMLHTELIRRGFAYIGISAQYVGVEGGGAALDTPVPFCLALKCFAPLRYASLSHPGDSFSYDIYRQAAQAIRHPEGIRPLGNLEAQRVIGAGQSQSAHRLITFINAFGRQTDLFDGFFVHSRIGPVERLGGSASAPLSEAPQAVVLPPSVVKIRDDLGAPVMNLQTETDQVLLGAASSRQPDTALYRLWEVAGTAHADTYVSNIGLTDPGDDIKAASVEFTQTANLLLGACPDNVSSAPQHHFVAKAAMRALNNWIITRKAPESFPRLIINAAGDDYERDSSGNAIAGVRSPYVDAPIARMTGFNSSGEEGLCFLYGSTDPLDQATIQSLYTSQADYVAAVTTATYNAVANGTILEQDAPLIIAAAQAATFPPQ